MTRRVVIDTNIIISAVISPLGNPAKILNMVFDEVIQPVCNAAILDEYDEVMARPRFKIAEQTAARYYRRACGSRYYR